MDFALNEVPTYEYDERAIEKIKQRLTYLEAVKKSNIFKFGTIPREKNKFDVFESIEAQLKRCLEVAAKEMLRRNARDELHRCHTMTANLLFSYAQSIYYLRNTDVSHEPLELKSYANADKKKLNAAAQALYPVLHASHTGKMLFEVLHLAGLDTFGVPNDDRISIENPVYFDRQGQLKSVDWEVLGNADLPPWVTPDNKKQQLTAMHRLAQSMLRIAQLKQLIDAAYELTGKVGDVWAYGDKEGKSSLKALIFLMEAEINSSKVQFDAIYAYHNESRQTYNKKHRINPDKGVNPNFNLLDANRTALEKHHAELKTSIKSIRDQMASFPVNAEQEMQAKKQKFYVALDDYFKKYYPEDRAQFNFNGIKSSKRKSDAKQVRFENQPKLLVLEPDMQFVLPIRKKYKSYWYYCNENLDNAIVNQVTQADITRYKKWQLGHSYDDWMNGYITRTHDQWAAYQHAAHLFEDTLVQGAKFDGAQQNQALLRTTITQLKAQIQLEMPAWRFQWSFMFIKTAGWPFNRKAARFAEHLLSELDHIEMRIEPAVAHMQKKLAESVNPIVSLIKSNSRIKPITRSVQVKSNQQNKLDDLKNNEKIAERDVFKTLSEKSNALILDIAHKIKAFRENRRLGFIAFKDLQDITAALDVFVSHKSLLAANKHFIINTSCDDLIELLQLALSENKVGLNAKDELQFTLTIKLFSFIKEELLATSSKNQFLNDVTKIFDEIAKLNLSIARSIHGFTKKQHTAQLPQSLIVSNLHKTL